MNFLRDGPQMEKESKLWRLLWVWLKPDKKLLYALIVIMIINVTLTVLGPVFLQRAIALMETETDLEPIQRTILLLTGIFSLSLLFVFFVEMTQNIMIAKLNPRFVNRLRLDIYSKLLSNNTTFFDQSEAGHIVSRVTNDTNEIIDSGSRFAEAFSSLIIFIAVLTVMLLFNPIITLASISVAPLLLAAVIGLRRLQRRITRNWRNKLSSVNARFGEVMGSISISKSFGREKRNNALFKELNEKTYHAAKIRGIAIFALGPIQDFVTTLSLIIMLYVSALQVIAGESIAVIFLFIMLRNYLYLPIRNIARSYNRFQSTFAALERILDLIRDNSLLEKEGGEHKKEDIKGNIVFENVNFSYLEDIPVLRNISFSLETGKTLALVGHTGSGKSTLVSLLMKYYEIQQGKIKIDSIPIEEFNTQELRSAIGYVSQDILLFSGTIRENLKLGNDSVTDQQLWDTLDIVQAREFIEMLPDGLDSQVVEGGKNLSQGQKQILSLARALLTDPKILILDEFTASLDIYTEAKIQKAIANLLKNRTSIVIAHRLTTILKADKIIVLRDGELIEEGTHLDLLENKKEYAEIFTKYFSHQLAGIKDLIIKKT